MTMPTQNAAPASASAATPPAEDFPADVRTVAVSAREFAGAGASLASRFRLVNRHETAVLHVRLTPGAGYLSVTPSEVALGPGEEQTVIVRTDTAKARAAMLAGEPPAAPVQMAFQRLFARSNGGGASAPSPAGTGAVYIRLPLATCPSCGRTLDDDPLGEGGHFPEVCPFCFERLRACPVCGAPNSWLARRCVIDANHVIRAAPDWGVFGGGPEHSGHRAERAGAALSRRWSFPSVAPSRREAALLWSAPVAAHGLVAASAATAEGEAHLYAFDAMTGAPLWEPYPLPDPVYPERGGAAISAQGRLFAATVEGVCACVDVLRGTRLWETTLPTGSRIYGALVPVAAGDDSPLLLVPAATEERDGCLFILDAKTGEVRRQVRLSGPPDSAPAFADGLAFVHDDSGTLTAVDVVNGAVRWSAVCDGGFDAAPVLWDGSVFSATMTGTVFCHDAQTGAETWRLAVTNSPFAGTPAHDGTLLYLPADDGVHLVSAAGKAVRRYPLRRPVRSAPVIAGGTLFFAATDGNVYGAESGRGLENLYQTGTVGSQIIAAPAFADGALFVAATNGVLYALTVGQKP